MVPSAGSRGWGCRCPFSLPHSSQGSKKCPHEPLPFSFYKDLKRSIRENGLKSPYTNGLFQAIMDSYRMAPCDWIVLARTVFTPAQFTAWHSEYSQQAGTKQPRICKWIIPSPPLCCLGLVILPPLADQARLDPHAFSQSAQIALRALKAMPSSQAREISSFTNIHQGASEAYMTWLITSRKPLNGKLIIIKRPRLLWQLAYENANKDCRAIIGPPRVTPREISEFIKACQDVGTKQHKASLSCCN